MTEDKSISPYERDVLELVTVAVEFCAFVEQADAKNKYDFVETMQKILPLLYLKGVLIPGWKSDEGFSVWDVQAPVYVTQENYEIVRNNVAFIMGDHDSYLDVFVEDMRYSDTPILSTISECIADIYQDLKNFVCAYKDGTEQMQISAIAQCKDNFRTYWGQRLTNVLRALHEISCSAREEFEDEDY